MAAVRCPLCGSEVVFGKDPEERVECADCGTSFLPARVLTARRTRPTPASLTGSRLGAYSIGERLGSGGMGIVYRAVHAVLGREAALKVLAPAVARDPDYRDRFLREARLCAALEHPGIVEIFGAAVEGEILYIAMELLRGKDLAEVVGGEGRLEPRRAAEVILSACSALQAAHKAGILHRDIKPENIMVTDSGAVKLTDFGLARRLRASTAITQPGVVMGTPGYMAPEHLEGADLDERSDIYSLGATFYFLLVGDPPYAGENLRSIIVRKRWEEVRPAKGLVPELPRALSDIAARMLAKSPPARYPSCAEVARDLRTFLDGGLVKVDVPTQQVPTSELPFGMVALRQKLITEDELLRCIRAQEALRRRWGDAPPLGEIMVREGLVSPEKVPLIVDLQAKGKPRCRNCGRRLSAGDAAGKASLCPVCRREMRGRAEVRVEEKDDEAVVRVRGACAHDELVQALRPMMARVGGKGTGGVALDITGLKNVVADFATEIVEWAARFREDGRAFKLVCSEAGWRVFERIGLSTIVRMEKASREEEAPARAPTPARSRHPASAPEAERAEAPPRARRAPSGRRRVTVLAAIGAASVGVVILFLVCLGDEPAAATAVASVWLLSFLAARAPGLPATKTTSAVVASGMIAGAAAGWWSSFSIELWVAVVLVAAAAGSVVGLRAGTRA